MRRLRSGIAVSLLVAVIVAVTAVVAVLVRGTGPAHLAGGDWQWSRVAIAFGAFGVVASLCWWRASWAYLLWALLALVSGIAWAANHPALATIGAAVTVLLGFALTFSRVTLRICTVAVIAGVVTLAVTYPPPEESVRLGDQQQLQTQLDAAEQARSQLIIGAQNSIAATGPDAAARAAAATAAGDEAVATAQHQLDETAAPTSVEGSDSPIRAVDVWVIHGFRVITGSPTNSPSPDLNAWQWALLVLAVLLIYRYLEVLSARHDPGPVTITAVSDAAHSVNTAPGGDAATTTSPGTEVLDLHARFGLWLDETELLNAASVPGGTETQRILKVLQTESSGDDIVDKILKLLRLIAAIAFPETGFTVAVASQHLGGEWHVTARLSDTRTSRVLAQIQQHSDTEEVAGRHAAYDVALAIARATNTLPRWALWDSSDPWMAYDQLAADTHPTKDRDATFKEAIRQSPANGLVRAGYANELLNRATGSQIGQAYVVALSQLLPIARTFRRFTPARYRLMVTLSYFATETGWAEWCNYGAAGTDADTKARVIRMIYPGTGPRDHAARVALRHTHTTDSAVSDRSKNQETAVLADQEGREAFRRAASRELNGLALYALGPVAAWWALVPSERRYWIGLLRTPRQLRHQRCAYAVGQRLLDVQALPSPTGEALQRWADRLQSEVNSVASRPHCGRQALYNAACFYAQLSEVLTETTTNNVGLDAAPQAHDPGSAAIGIAFRFLYRAVYEPEGGAWSSDWIVRDPDLEVLRNDSSGNTRPRWTQLLAELSVDTPDRSTRPSSAALHI